MLIKPIKRVEMSIKPTRHGELSIKPIKREALPIKPISVTESNTAFKATVKNNEIINEGFEMVYGLLKNPTMKDLEFVKIFYDSLRKIAASKKLKSFEIDLIKEGSGIYPRINGSKLDIDTGSSPYLQKAYIVHEGCKKFAESLNDNPKKTVLDSISQRIIKLYSEISRLKEDYKETLESELEKLQKEIV